MCSGKMGFRSYHDFHVTQKKYKISQFPCVRASPTIRCGLFYMKKKCFNPHTLPKIIQRILSQWLLISKPHKNVSSYLRAETNKTSAKTCEQYHAQNNYVEFS